MISEIDFFKIKKRIDESGSIWINVKYTVDGEAACTEFFIKKLDKYFRVGFDDYLEKYEDATDLYFSNLRKNFDDLSSAINFSIESLFINKHDLLVNKK